MNKEKTNQNETATPEVVEDLTLKETDAENVKGGPIYMKYNDGAVKGDVTT